MVALSAISTRARTETQLDGNVLAQKISIGENNNLGLKNAISTSSASNNNLGHCKLHLVFNFIRNLRLGYILHVA